MALHGNDAYERKLRPLYDALDARSWKQAAKLADAALKKYKGDQLVRALKGYALFRCGRDDEALQMMHDITTEGPEAERVLMTMTYTLKAAGKPEAVAQAYIAAAEMHPRDVEILEGLFKSHVRNFDFVKQQQVAMRLSKLMPAGPDNLCSWWIVCSLALQARAALLQKDQRGNPLGAQEGRGGLAADKLLQLAETIAARQVAPVAAVAPATAGQDGSAALSYEALLLYLDLLQGQGKAQQAVEVVQGPLGRAVPLPADRLQLRAAALVRAGDLPAASACYLQAVQAAPDDWLSWQLYLDCMLPRSSSSSSSSSSSGGRFPVGVVGGLAEIWDRQQQQGTAAGGEEEVKALAAVEESVSQLGARLAASDSWRLQLERGTLRGPCLWACELLLRRQRLAQAADNDAPAANKEQQQEMAAAVGEAFAKLAATFSCANDLRPYLATLAGAAATQLAAQVHTQAAKLNAEEGQAAGSSSSSSSSEAMAAAGEPAPVANGASSSSSGGPGQSSEVRRLQRLVNAHQIELELGLPRFATAEEAAGHAAALLDLYRRHMHLSADLDEKERGYGEELVVGAVQALMAAAALEAAAAQQAATAAAAPPPPPPGRTIARMLQAVLVLEAAQQRRKVSAPLRLAATALYSLLGAPKLAAAQFGALDIKSILHDSMTGHWLLPLLAGGADADADLARWVDGCARLHELHQADAGESLSLALKHGTYSKVSEFVDFKERLQHSHTRALAAVGGALLGGSSRGSKAASNSESGEVSWAGQQAALQHARQLLAAATTGALAAARDEPAAESGVADGGAGGGGRTHGAQLLLRFNEDLSTRPCWYPPASASGSSVTDWWRGAANGRPAAGYAHCWWAQPLAAEGPTPAAAAWRQRCLAELRVQLAWALTSTSSLANAVDAAALLEQVQPLLPQPQTEADAGPDGSLQGPACRAGLAVLLALGGAAAEDEAAVQQLGQACTSAAQQASANLADAGHLPLLPGSVTSAAAAVAADCRRIAAVCSRLQKLCAAAGRKTAAAAAAETAYSAAAAGKAVAQASAELATEALEQRVERVMQLLDSCRGGDGSGDALWSFEPALDARSVVAAVVQAQMAVLRSTSSSNYPARC